MAGSAKMYILLVKTSLNVIARMDIREDIVKNRESLNAKLLKYTSEEEIFSVKEYQKKNKFANSHGSHFTKKIHFFNQKFQICVMALVYKFFYKSIF